jgi:hypothetical protein
VGFGGMEMEVVCACIQISLEVKSLGGLGGGETCCAGDCDALEGMHGHVKETKTTVQRIEWKINSQHCARLCTNKGMNVSLACLGRLL